MVTKRKKKDPILANKFRFWYHSSCLLIGIFNFTQNCLDRKNLLWFFLRGPTNLSDRHQSQNLTASWWNKRKMFSDWMTTFEKYLNGKTYLRIWFQFCQQHILVGRCIWNCPLYFCTYHGYINDDSQHIHQYLEKKNSLINILNRTF